MNNNIMIYNNMLSFNLKQEMNNVNDLLYNIQNLKQLQCSIDQIQQLKDKAQMQTNMASLALLRSYILDEGYVGVTLFRNLIRSFYPLNDEQILKYEVIKEYSNTLLADGRKVEAPYCFTNVDILRRKGKEFYLNGKKYEWSLSLDRTYKWNYKTDFHEDKRIESKSSQDVNARRLLMENEFIHWDWELVATIHKGRSFAYRELHISHLLENAGFVIQMGLNNIDETINKLQEISGATYSSAFIEKIKKDYEEKGEKLCSYQSLSKEYIFSHQDKLDWEILYRNPYIQWDWELINLLLKQFKNNVSETEWNVFYDNPSYAIYQVIEPFLNDELLDDIEKLYPNLLIE